MARKYSNNNWTARMIEVMFDLKRQGNKCPAIARQLNEMFNTDFSSIAVNHKLNRVGDVSSEDKNLVNRGNQTLNNGTQSTTAIREMHVGDEKTPEEILLIHGLDPNRWEMASATDNFWMQSQDATMYQTKIKVKPLHDFMHDKQLIDTFVGDVKPVNLTHVKIGNRNLVIPLADMHFGWTKLADVKPALNEIVNIMDKGYKQIVIEILGDTFHSDFINSSKTVSGTELDPADMVKAVADAKSFFNVLLMTAYENAAKVSVKYVGGNHSFDIEYMFTEVLKASYPQIDIDVNNDYRNAYLLDNVGILIAHGDFAKKSLPMLFATENTDVWSSSKWREIHTGHFHKKLVEDEYGVITRQMGTIKPTDSYESQNGYTMAHHGMTLYEYDKDRLKATYNI